MSNLTLRIVRHQQFYTDYPYRSCRRHWKNQY